MIPTRVSNLDRARKLYGSRADFFASFFDRGDPLADEAVEALGALPERVGFRMLERALADGIHAVMDAPPALQRLFAAVDDVPEWVDWDRLRLGARTYQRTGIAGGMVLSAFALMNGYHSHAATKPLVLTGELDRMARRRLAETGRFITDTIQVDGLRRNAPGFRSTIKVRLLHARVRRFLSRSKSWDHRAWGLPINQADMCATNLSFSIVVLRGTRALGLRFTAAEADSLMELWRYSGYLSGVDPGLLPASESEAAVWADLVAMLQPGPDEGSRRLAAALRAVTFERARTPLARALAPWLASYHDGLTRATAGAKIAEGLGIGNAAWEIAIPVTRALVTPLELARERLPFATWLSAALGNRVWCDSVEKELGGKPATFHVSGRSGRRPAA